MRLSILLAVAMFLCAGTQVTAAPKAWFSSETEAKAYALENKVPILYVFAGSDWCKPCIQLKQTILTSEAFQQYHPAKVAVLYLDFPQQQKNQLPDELRKQNEKLAGVYNKAGYFPYIVVVSAEGKTIGTIAFKHQTPEVFIEQCEALLATQKP